MLDLLQFLLTRPMRGVTSIPCNRGNVYHISTHTPHAGRDVNTGLNLREK